MTVRRIIFDTSTLVSAALRPGSIPHRTLQHAPHFCDLCASTETLSELKKVLAREKFRRYMPNDARRQFVRMIENNLQIFVVRDLEDLPVNPPCRDPADNKFLALAFACEADAIISSDEDLLVLHPWNGVQLLRPADFLGEPR